MLMPMFLISTVGIVVLVSLAVIILVYLGTRIKIVPQAAEYVIERCGNYLSLIHI